MARPRKITDDQLLTAAREMFLAHGPQVSTSEIAAHAGVSEGTLFRRFSTKQELFLAAIGHSDSVPWVASLDDLASSDDLEEDLLSLANQALDIFLQMIPCTSLLMSSSMAKGIKPLKSDQAAPVAAIKALTHLFDAWQRRGRLSPSDPEVLARMFAGSLIHYVFATHSGLNDWLPMPRQTYLRGVVRALFGGLII